MRREIKDDDLLRIPVVGTLSLMHPGLQVLLWTTYIRQIVILNKTDEIISFWGIQPSQSCIFDQKPLSTPTWFKPRVWSLLLPKSKAANSENIAASPLRLEKPNDSAKPPIHIECPSSVGIGRGVGSRGVDMVEEASTPRRILLGRLSNATG